MVRLYKPHHQITKMSLHSPVEMLMLTPDPEWMSVVNRYKPGPATLTAHLHSGSPCAQLAQLAHQPVNTH